MSAPASTPTATGKGHSSGEPPCPLCGEPLFAWLALPDAGSQASVGVPVESERVVGRCENCGAALERGREADVASEWGAVASGGEIAVPNRASLQAAIGTEGWAAFDQAPGALMLTTRSLELLAERNGFALDGLGTPVSRHAHAWMWQTLINGLTFHPNFAREVRAGRLRMSNSRNRFAFVADCVATVLAAPLVALVSVPLELIAAAIGRGGEIRASARRNA